MPTPINEFQTFTETHSYSGSILSITVTPAFPLGLNLVETINSVTVSTPGVEIFDRSITYLDSNDVISVATKFNQLPTSYHAVTQYIGASASTIDYTVDITTDENDPISQVPPKAYQYVYTLVSNYSTANQMLKQKVSEGLY